MTNPGFPPLSPSRPSVEPFALCIVSAALCCASFLAFSLFPLAWIGFVPVLWAVRGMSPIRAFRYGALFGTLANAGGFYWLIHVASQFGQLPLPAAILVYLLLCLFQGLMLAFVVGLVRLAQRNLHIAPIWSFPVILVTFEWLYPLLFHNYFANSQFRFTAVTQIVEITGVLGLSALIAFVNGAVYELLEAFRSSRRVVPARLALPAGALLLCIGYGMLRLPAVASMTASADILRAAIPQTNIGGQEKEADMAASFRAHVEMSSDALDSDTDIDLLIWPETAYDRLVEQRGGTIVGDIDLGLNVPAILGTLSYEIEAGEVEPRLFNSVALVGADGAVLGSFHKVHLLAFGETLPFGERFPALRRLVPDIGAFTPGTSFETLDLDGISFLPMICYEDLIPSLVRRIWRESGPADVLVNVTNDSWYGDTHEPMQHLALASFRAIETRRALVRATNTGISAVIEPTGRVASRTGQWTREVLIADVPLIRDGSSTLYMRFGDVIAYVFSGLMLAGMIAAYRNRGRGG